MRCAEESWRRRDEDGECGGEVTVREGPARPFLVVPDLPINRKRETVESRKEA